MRGPGIEPLNVIAWNLVPASSMTTSFSLIVSLNSMIFGASLVACSCACTKGGATSSTAWRGSLRSSAASAGAVATRAATAAPSNAVRRVIMTRSFSVPAFEFVSPLCLERHGRSLSQRKLSDERHIAALFAAGQRSVQPDANARYDGRPGDDSLACLDTRVHGFQDELRRLPDRDVSFCGRSEPGACDRSRRIFERASARGCLRAGDRSYGRQMRQSVG